MFGSSNCSRWRPLYVYRQRREASAVVVDRLQPHVLLREYDPQAPLQSCLQFPRCLAGG